MSDYPLLHKPENDKMISESKPQIDVDNIKKNYDHLISYAIKNPTSDNINALFSAHPFYKNLTIEKKGKHLVCNYSIFTIKKDKWENYVSAVFGEENRDTL